MKIDDEEVAQTLHVLDMTDYDEPALFHEVSTYVAEDNVRRTGQATSTALNLARHCKETGSKLVITDNASDVYAADENTRMLVRKFMQFLSRMGREIDGAVLLLAHVDKETARYARHSESYSGSTAWHNSARSRLFLTPEKDAVTLKHEKSNYGPTADDMTMSWMAGALAEGHVVDPREAAQREQTDKADIATILRYIRTADEQGSRVSTSPTSGNAHVTLSQMHGFPEMRRKRLEVLIERAIDDGLLARVFVTDAHRKRRQVYQVTEAGEAFITPRSLP